MMARYQTQQGKLNINKEINIEKIISFLQLETGKVGFEQANGTANYDTRDLCSRQLIAMG